MGKIDGFLEDETAIETPVYLRPVRLECTDCGHSWIEDNPVVPTCRRCDQCGKLLSFFIVEPNAPADLPAVAGKVRRDVGFDFDAAITPHILRNWSRDRIIAFAKHLLGDECQSCSKPNSVHHVTSQTA